ncbi:MAG: hypothetical protein ACOC1O_05670 [bacterium]
MLNVFFAVFFGIVGIAGLIYGVETGVFIGLALFPWQIIQVTKKINISVIVIIICTIPGFIFFLHSKEWLLLLFFSFLQLYNYWGCLNIKDKESDKEIED